VQLWFQALWLTWQNPSCLKQSFHFAFKLAPILTAIFALEMHQNAFWSMATIPMCFFAMATTGH